MLSFFQKAYLSQYIVLLLLTLVFWMPSSLLSETYKGTITPAFDIVTQLFMNNALIMNFIALIITLLLGLLIKNIAGEFDFSSKLATTGMLLFLVFASSLTPFTLFNPFIVVNILLLFFIRSLFMLPTTEYSIPLVFNAAIILGVASMFYLPTVFFFLLIWFSLIIHRSNSWRNYVVSIAGILMPHIFIMTWYFWNDNLSIYLETWINLFEIKLNFVHFEISLDLIIGILFLSLFIIAAFGTFNRLSEKKIIPRRNQLITLYYFLFTLLIFFLFSESLNPALMMVIPGTFILTNFLQGARQYKIYNIVFVIIVVLIVGNQYFQLIYPFLNMDS